jgi:uncharacterized membrane protein YhaH (DUF805 family)
MLRLLFPKISFSGRLNRAQFWCEITVSAVTTPIAVGIVSVIVHQAVTAAGAGLAIDHFKVKAVIALLLANYTVSRCLPALFGGD